MVMRRLVRSFGDAFRGVAVLLRTQPNARIHTVATVFAVALGFILHIRATEWLAVTLAIALVWTAEGLNTALELLADRVAPEPHPLVARAKDAAAAGVLIAAMGALAVGLLVFLPRLIRLT